MYSKMSLQFWLQAFFYKCFIHFIFEKKILLFNFQCDTSFLTILFPISIGVSITQTSKTIVGIVQVRPVVLRRGLYYIKYNYTVRYLSTWLYKQDPATEFIKLRSTPFKDGATLAPKLADPLSFWRSSSTPFKYWIKYS